MHNSNIPTDRELPSTQKLVKSTILAAIVAVALLITIVLPAEYGIDPTGLGKVINLKKMGEIKVALAEEVAADNAKDVQQQVVQEKQVTVTPVVVEQTVSEPAKLMKQETISVTLTPNQGTEVKASMRKGATVKYKWSTNGGRANFDVHADSKALKIKYHNYEKGSEQTKEGTLTAAFDGSHGWFWRNRTSKTLTIALNVSGEYTTLKQME